MTMGVTPSLTTLSIMDFDNMPVNAFVRLVFFLAYGANQLDIKTLAGMGIYTGLFWDECKHLQHT